MVRDSKVTSTILKTRLMVSKFLKWFDIFIGNEIPGRVVGNCLSLCIRLCLSLFAQATDACQ